MPRTSIVNRKTPHAKVLGRTVYDLDVKTRTKYKRVLDLLDIEDINSPTVIRYVPISRIYVRSGNQNIPDDDFKNTDLRNCTTELWNARSAGFRKYGKFMTNWEFKNFSNRATLPIDEIKIYNKKSKSSTKTEKETVATIDSFMQ